MSAKIVLKRSRERNFPTESPWADISLISTEELQRKIRSDRVSFWTHENNLFRIVS